MVAGLDRAMGDFVFEFDDTFMDYPFEVLDRMYDSAVERVRRRRRRPRQPRVASAVVLRGLQLVLGRSSRRSATSGCACRHGARSTRCSTSGSGSATGRCCTATPATGTCGSTTRPTGPPATIPHEPALRAGRLLLVHRRGGPDLAGVLPVLRSGVGPVDRGEHLRVHQRQGDRPGSWSSRRSSPWGSPGCTSSWRWSASTPLGSSPRCGAGRSTRWTRPSPGR